MLKDIANEETLADFAVAYFADNDYVSHEVGPVNALPVIERVDRMLGEAFDAAGGMERFLENRAVIVTSDHGHCDVLKERGNIVRLDHLLADFRQADLGKPWKKQDEIMICPNMRAAQIYVRSPAPEQIERLAVANAQASGYRSDHLALDIVRRPPEATPSRAAADGFDSRGMPRASTCIDSFGGLWSWSGDAAVLGISQAGRAVEYPDYPNAFERIAGVLDLEKSGEIWVTARPGCEFEVPGRESPRGWCIARCASRPRFT